MSNKSKLIKNSFIYTIGDMLPKVINFFIIPLLTYYMSTAEYGIYGYVTTVIGFFSMFYLLGIDGALTRFYYNYKTEEDKETFLSTLWIFLFLYNLVITTVLLVYGEGLSKIILKGIPFDPYFKLILFYCFFNTFTVMPLILIRMKEQALKFGIFNILTTCTSVVLIYYFVAYKRLGAKGYLRANITTYAVFACIYFFIMVKGLRIRFSKKILKEALKFGIPLIPHAIGGWVLMVSDRYFLNAYRTTSEIGIYTLAYQFGTLVYYLIAAINKAYVPFFFKTAEEDNNAKSIFEEVNKYYAIFILSIGLLIALFSKEIILIMIKNKSYHIAYTVVPIIALAYVFDGLYYMCINNVFYAKKTNVLVVTTGITAVVDLIMNYLLIPIYGMYGAAIATAIAYLTLFILTYIAGQRYYYTKWNWKVICINFAICFGVYFAGNLLDVNNLVNLLYKIMIFCLYILLLFIFKILSYERLNLMKSKILKR